MSWLPGTLSAVPACDIDITVFSVSTIRGPAVHEVADKDRLPSCRAGPRGTLVPLVAELLKQLFEFVAATVNVADDIERSRLALRLFHSGCWV